MNIKNCLMCMAEILWKAFKIARMSLVVLVLVSVVVFLLYLFGVVFQPLSPLITLCVVLLFTVFTFINWMNAVLSVGGIVLYTASWFVAGAWVATAICFLGILVWFVAVYRSFRNLSATAKTISA